VIPLLCLIACWSAGCRKKAPPVAMAILPALPSIEERWNQAAARVEEDRAQPIGSHAVVQVPEELKRYAERHRFLAMQAAEREKQSYPLPADFVELMQLVQGGQLVEVSYVSDDYILFGVGGIASDGPLTHYDRGSGTSIPLYSGEDELKQAEAAYEDWAKQLKDHISEAEKERSHGRHDRAGRREMGRRIAEDRARLSSSSQDHAAAMAYYGNPIRRAQMFDECESLAKFAADFAGRSYDLSSATDRLAFKVRLLSFMRPSALTILEEIAAGYHKQFNRPLPVTSLIRTAEYQHDLSQRNPNAARNSAPPHTTGLAFDIYYHFMEAAEQNFLMAEIGRLKDAGKVEALRETRDHFHVFAFADGKPPPESLVSASVAELAGRGYTAKLGRRAASRASTAPRIGARSATRALD
jgi:hypothetical protein